MKNVEKFTETIESVDNKEEMREMLEIMLSEDINNKDDSEIDMDALFEDNLE